MKKILVQRMLNRKYMVEVLYLLGTDKRKLPGLLFLFLGVSVLDLVGIGIVGPYIALTLDLGKSNGYFGKIISSLGLPNESFSLLSVLSVMLFMIFLVKTVLSILVQRIIIRFSLDRMGDLRTQLMESYQRMAYAEHVKRNSSEYIYSIQTLTSQYTSQVLQPLLYIISNGILTIAILVLLAWEDFLALILLIVLFGTVVIGYDRLFRNKINGYGEKSNIASTLLVQGIHEGIEGLKEVRILSKEDYFYQMVKTNAQDFSLYNTYSQVISAVPRYLLELMMVLFLVLLIMITISNNGDVQAMFPTLAMFGVAALRLLPFVNTLSTSLVNLRYSRDSVSRLYSDIKSMEGLKTCGLAVNDNKTHKPFKSISLENVTFGYPQGNSEILNKVSLTIKYGESVGLIGSSGSGKTTLIDIILGLLVPQEGMIQYNGRPISQSWDEWRSHIAYLPQEVFLIDNTLRNNIALGINNNEINEDKIDNAIKQARLTEVVSQLAHGKDTFLGERGVRLSGGQRQRVALARAFYHNRSVLVMDESTSALDNETEREIVDEIERLKGKVTMIIVAHRLTTLQHCDKIYEICKGQIVNENLHEEKVKL